MKKLLWQIDNALNDIVGLIPDELDHLTPIVNYNNFSPLTTKFLIKL